MLAATLALVVAAGDAAAALQHCAAIADNAARLSCYDMLAHETAPAAPAASAPAPAAPDTFGLAVPEKPAAEPETRTAHIVGSFTSWQPGTVITLDNGQSWKVSGEDRGFHRDIPDNAEVTITPSHFGGYVLEIKAIGRKISVRRVS